MAKHTVVWHGRTCHGVSRTMAWCGVAWLGVALCGVVWRGVAWRGVAWRAVRVMVRWGMAAVEAWHSEAWHGVALGCKALVPVMCGVARASPCKPAKGCASP